MASARFLEEALSTDVDESAVSAIVGSLENHLVTATPSRTVVGHTPGTLRSTDRSGRMSNYPNEIDLNNYHGRPSDAGNGANNLSVSEQHRVSYPQPPLSLSSAINVGNRVVFPSGHQLVAAAVPRAASRPTVLQQPISNIHNMVTYTKPGLAQQAVQPNMHIVNMRPNSSPMNATKVVSGPPRILLGPPQVRAAAQGMTMQPVPGLQHGQPGHLLLKTENGQYQLLRVGPSQGRPPTAQVQVPGAPSWSPGVTPISTSSPQQLQFNQPVVTHHTPPTHLSTEEAFHAQQNLLMGSQKLSDTKEKCRNFLANLLDLSSKEPKPVELNVKNLIQELIDALVEPEEFCERLECLLNASPQPCLIGFLKKSLPFLRQSLLTKELLIEGIRPPATRVAYSSLESSLPSQSVFTNSSPLPILPKAFSTKAPSSANKVSIIQNVNIQQQQLTKSGNTLHPVVAMSGPSRTNYQRPSTSKSLLKERENKAYTGYSQYYSERSVPENNINNTSVMSGGQFVENQPPHGSTDVAGPQTSIFKDYLIPIHEMQSRVKAVSQRHGLAEPDLDVAAMMSYAAEEYVKRLIRKVALATEHRLENQRNPMENDPRYEVSQDVKGQLKFLEELDQVDKKRRQDTERELLLRAAKSRSKNEDPEQAKLKAKAKEMQRVEMEELRQREANVTALQAIGPRKKPRLDLAGGSGDANASTSAASSAAYNTAGPSNQSGVRRRVKRVVMRDMCFMMEQEKHLARSIRLYCAYLK